MHVCASVWHVCGMYVCVCMLALPMMSDEDVVPLIVKGDNSPALKLWLLGKPGGQQSSHAVAESRGEVV